MIIKDFIDKMFNKHNFSFYMNDKIIDLEDLEDSTKELDGFSFEDNVVRLYSSEF